MQTAVAPRPIALASTVNKKGEINLSPFSFFNMVSTNPPILVFSASRRVRDQSNKHTLHNIEQTKQVVIGIVNYAMVQQVSLSSTEYPAHINEFEKAGLTMGKSEKVAPPLILESPVNFECEVKSIQSFGEKGGAGNLIICEVVNMHLQEEYLNAEGMLDQKKLDLVARLGGAYYSRNNDANLFEVPKPLSTLGIGIDALPMEIRQSEILSGNDLGLLANIENLQGQLFSGDPSDHSQAKNLISQGKVKEAWEILTRN